MTLVNITYSIGRDLSWQDAKDGISGLETSKSAGGEVAASTNHTAKRRTPTVYPQFIYCATDGGDLVKVGWSCDPVRRVRALERESGRILTLARTWSLGRIHRGLGHSVESHIHASLGRKSLRDGEWYAQPVADVLPVISFAILDMLWAYRRLVKA